MSIRVSVISTALAAAVLALCYSASTDAAEGTVCLSVSTAAGPILLPIPVNNELKFQCGAVGEMTIPDVYKNGWRVVSIWSQMTEEQTIQWAMVIEKA